MGKIQSTKGPLERTAKRGKPISQAKGTAPGSPGATPVLGIPGILSGVTSPGDTLTYTPATWVGSPSVSWQWWSGTQVVQTGGLTRDNLSTDLGNLIVVIEVAKGPTGRSSSYSNGVQIQ